LEANGCRVITANHRVLIHVQVLRAAQIDHHRPKGCVIEILPSDSSPSSWVNHWCWSGYLCRSAPAIRQRSALSTSLSNVLIYIRVKEIIIIEVEILPEGIHIKRPGALTQAT
jgi:hypothetical protein